jgi:hypothetical protein
MTAMTVRPQVPVKVPVQVTLREALMAMAQGPAG